MPEGRTQIAIAVVERDGMFLVGQRPSGKPLAGYSEFPGGRVEPGETPEEAAVRECLEETGLSIRVVGSYDDCLHEYSHDTVHLRFFACRVNAGSRPARAPFRWVNRACMATLEFPDANRNLLSELLTNGGRS